MCTLPLIDIGAQLRADMVPYPHTPRHRLQDIHKLKGCLEEFLVVCLIFIDTCVKAIQLVPFVTNAYVCVYRIKTDCVCLSCECAPRPILLLVSSVCHCPWY